MLNITKAACHTAMRHLTAVFRCLQWGVAAALREGGHHGTLQPGVIHGLRQVPLCFQMHVL